MTKEPLFKQFVGLVTKWVRDEFLITWLRLVSIYVLTSGILLSALSFVIYVAVKGNLITTIGVSIFNPFTQEMVLMEALEALKERIITADILMMIVVVLVGILLSYRALSPIKKSMVRQKRFIADAAHELRTPLAVLKLDLELLLRNKNNNNDMQKSLSGLHNEVNSIIDLTNSLLLLSKNKSAAQKETIHIYDFITNTVDGIKKLFPDKNISTNIHIDANIKYDVVIVDAIRIFTNIIKNAFQYTPEQGTIDISASMKHKKLYTVITDTGVGIHKENLSKIFEPFYQEEASHTHDGAGLGLSMVKKLVEKHSGTITIESKKNKGTTVTIML